MRRLLLLVGLAGCPAPPAPETTPPPPPAPVVVAIDATPPLVVPAVVAARVADGAIELVRFDPTGEARVLHTLARKAALPRVADLAIDPASGRYAALIEADTIDGDATGTPRNVMTLVLGTVDGASIAIGPGDQGCKMHKCFESAVAIAPGGEAIVTTLVRSGASDLARYAFEASPTPTRLTAKGVEKPALSPDHGHVAYLRGKAIYVIESGSDATAKPMVTGLADVAALALGSGLVAYRTGAGVLGALRRGSQTPETLANLAADPRPVLRVAADLVFTTDGDQVVVVDSAPRALATGALIDVSADGAWVLVEADGVLSVVATADGEVAARHDVKSAFGEVRARLSP